MKTLMIILTLLALIAPAAQASGTFEYRYWQGFTNSTVLQYTRQGTLWGVRAWAAFGTDDPTPFWRDQFGGLDVTYRLTRHARAYLGYEYLYRDVQVNREGANPPLMTFWNVHQGSRVGFMGTVPFSRRFEAIYDFTYLPADRVTVNGQSATGTGRIYQWGLRYHLNANPLNPDTYLEAGHWDFRFEIPQSLGGGSHVWLGPYLALGRQW